MGRSGRYDSPEGRDGGTAVAPGQAWFTLEMKVAVEVVEVKPSPENIVTIVVQGHTFHIPYCRFKEYFSPVKDYMFDKLDEESKKKGDSKEEIE